MKIYFLSLILLAFVGLNCKKNNSSSTPAKSKTDMLTAHMMVYDILYFNWGQQNQQLVYSKGASNNVFNMAPDRVHFYRDGTYEEYTQAGVFITGNWQFLNNETQVRVWGPSYSNTATIKILTEDVFEWQDDGNKTYGRQISKK